MPEMTFTVRWPDGALQDCYSPSLVMHDHLDAGAVYGIDEFVTRTGTALDLASARVMEKYGFACTSAMAQKSDIEERSAAFDGTDRVQVLSMHPPLPIPTPTPESAS